MGIQICWDNEEHTILRYDFDVHWIWSELYTATDTATAMIDSVPHAVGSIFIIPHRMVIPNDVLTHSKNLIKQRHPRTVVSTVVVQGIYLRSLLHIMNMVSNDITYRIVPTSTLEEARSVIRKQLRVVSH